MRNFLRALRIIIAAVRQGDIRLVDFTGGGEEHTDREYIGHYGFTSRPLDGAEGIALFLKGGSENAVVITTDDRRYRIPLSNGECALYTDEGDSIHLKRGNIIEINGAKKVIVNTENAEVNASAKVTVTTPQAEFSQDVKILGKLDVTGNVSSGAQISDVTGTMNDMRGTYNGHTHPENDNGGPTSSPNQPMN